MLLFSQSITCQEGNAKNHIGYHSQHLYLADPKYGNGVSKSFRYFDVVHLTPKWDRHFLGALEILVSNYTPDQVNRVTSAKDKTYQLGGDDILAMIFFGAFTLIGVVGTDQPDRWKKCGNLSLNGGRLAC